jgi:leucyl-tRNA synthetase
MSVPGHAPYDYVALETLRRQPSQLEGYGIAAETMVNLKPISLIEVPGYSEIPAGDAVKKMGIRDQSDRKLEEATKEVYRVEFHTGKMKSYTGKYAGMPVAEAKDIVKQDLIREGRATTMYELLNRPVFCRCKTECIVKILEDQWFIDYGKPEWKKLAHKNLDMMEILPEEFRQEFNNVIDWLHEKACARKSGMGTRLPWDPDWIIESLSDSTIYMAYYTIVTHLKKHRIGPEQLTDEVFDYVFLGKGKADEIAKKAGLNNEVLEQMRQEFCYFYPLDSRHSGRDLIPNHLTFMLFNHTAIFPEELWPRQIVANGVVLMEGAKMSKSFGNIIPLREGIARFGADPVRMGLLSTAELVQDGDFSPSIAKSMRTRLERLYRFACELAENPRAKSVSTESLEPIDRWMLSRLQHHIEDATQAMDNLAVRKAVNSTLYELDQDFHWYQRRIAGQEAKPKRKDAIAYVFSQVLDSQTRMLAPVAPHVCEELWQIVGKGEFISQSPWPKTDETLMDALAEEKEAFIVSIVEDTLNIIKATRTKPKKICYYTAASWKWKTYLKALEQSRSLRVTQKDLMKELMQNSDFRSRAEEVATFTGHITEDINRMSEETKQKQDQIGLLNETQTLNEAKNFLEKELKAKICVYGEEDPNRYDPKNRASLAKPYRPAIFIE